MRRLQSGNGSRVRSQCCNHTNNRHTGKYERRWNESSLNPVRRRRKSSRRRANHPNSRFHDEVVMLICATRRCNDGRSGHSDAVKAKDAEVSGAAQRARQSVLTETAMTKANSSTQKRRASECCTHVDTQRTLRCCRSERRRSERRRAARATVGAHVNGDDVREVRGERRLRTSAGSKAHIGAVSVATGPREGAARLRDVVLQQRATGLAGARQVLPLRCGCTTSHSSRCEGEATHAMHESLSRHGSSAWNPSVSHSCGSTFPISRNIPLIQLIQLHTVEDRDAVGLL